MGIVAVCTITNIAAFANIICTYIKYYYQLQEKGSNYLSLFEIQYLYRYDLAKLCKYCHNTIALHWLILFHEEVRKKER